MSNSQCKLYVIYYYQKLWTKQSNDNTAEGKHAKLTENFVDLITVEELETTIKALKARKSPASGGINNELYKHATKSFLHKFLNLMFVGPCIILIVE